MADGQSEAGHTVLYVVGKGRSGSNLLAHALGQLDGYCNTGELYHLWRWGLQEGARCGCGQPVPSCPLWSAVAQDPTVAVAQWSTIHAWQREVLTWRNAPRLLAHARLASWDALQRYVNVRACLYATIARITGAAVLIDASKWPWDPAVLGYLPGVAVRVVHLVRDPRAVAHSWRRVKSWEDQAGASNVMPQFRTASSAASWLARNTVVELALATHRQPSLRLRYEDFVASPRQVMDQICALAGHPADPPLVDDRSLRLVPTHSVGGNAAKFQTGTVRLRLDDEWQWALPTPARWLATGLASPLLRRYSYAFTGAPQPPSGSVEQARSRHASQ